uniref:ATP synthase subunit a n=1 Tax=Hirudo medicinalis TaxID=6421 RepID=A0A342KB37_HIRME|nr:ATP synthase F0 subunit 6 [Hirudo medicinalis]
MFLDVFTIFDVYEFNSLLKENNIFMVTFMLIPIMLFFFLTLSLWNFSNFMCVMKMNLMNVMNNQVLQTNCSMIKGMSNILCSLFLVLISLNLFGLVSFSYSITSHLLLSMAIGIPLWLMINVSSFMFKSNLFVAHLLPDGAPLWLNPFLVLVESISILVRPITLSFRLAANMTAGHVVLCLMFLFLSSCMNKISLKSMFLLLLSSLYIMFEIAICIIQGYIFCLLLSLYSDDSLVMYNMKY